jgi:hypothetical protein
MEIGYNGWTNYETWRVNLEVIDGYDANDILGDYARDGMDRDEMVDALAGHFEDFVDEMVMPEGINGFAADLVSHFIHKVNYHEIAEHYVDDYLDTNPSDENTTCTECDTEIAKCDACVTTAGRIVCKDCAEGTV